MLPKRSPIAPWLCIRFIGSKWLFFNSLDLAKISVRINASYRRIKPVSCNFTGLFLENQVEALQRSRIVRQRFHGQVTVRETGMLRDATLDLLKYTPLPSIGKALNACGESIMARWQVVVKQKLPCSDQLTREQLRDELPDILRELSVVISAKDGSHFEKLEKVSEGHGLLRFHQSFDVDELLIEYGILRSIVLDEIASHMRRDLSPEEAAALNMGLDLAVRKSVTNFSAFQQNQLKIVAEAQSKYLSFLSHDLRGGLNGVLLMVEVLKRELAGEARFDESVQDLDSMRRSIMDTVGTMDRFLHAERFRQGKVQPRNSTVHLVPVLGELVQMFNYQAKAKGLLLVLNIPPATVAHTDKDLLLLIVQNLLSNAIKYTPAGQIVLSVQRTSTDILQLSVTDQGPGIAPDRLNTLFDPYMRGETHGQDGVGLGLSIAKQAADLIRAKLTVKSEVGKGSSFILSLSEQ